MREWLRKFWYTFNSYVLFWIPGIIIASSYHYEEDDEYVQLRADGLVIVRSKKNPKCTDVLPVTMVSDSCVERLLKSRFK